MVTGYKKRRGAPDGIVLPLLENVRLKGKKFSESIGRLLKRLEKPFEAIDKM